MDPSSPHPLTWMHFGHPLRFAAVPCRGMWQLWENVMEVIEKMEKTNTMTNTWGKTRTDKDKLVLEDGIRRYINMIARGCLYLLRNRATKSSGAEIGSNPSSGNSNVSGRGLGVFVVVRLGWIAAAGAAWDSPSSSRHHSVLRGFLSRLG